MDEWIFMKHETFGIGRVAHKDQSGTFLFGDVVCNLLITELVFLYFGSLFVSNITNGEFSWNIHNMSDITQRTILQSINSRNTRLYHAWPFHASKNTRHGEGLRSRSASCVNQDCRLVSIVVF